MKNSIQLQLFHNEIKKILTVFWHKPKISNNIIKLNCSRMRICYLSSNATERKKTPFKFT